MKRWILLLLVLAALTTAVQAADVQAELEAQFGTDTLTDGLPAEAEQLLDGRTAAQPGDLLEGIQSILQQGIRRSGGAIKQASALMLRVLVIVILCQLSDSICDEQGQAVAAMTGAVALMVCCTADMQVMIGLGRTTMDSLSGFSNLLLPVMTAAAVSTGAVTSAGLTYSVSVFFLNLLVQFSNYVVIPGIYAYAALAAADGILQQERLKKLRAMLGWGIEMGLKGVVYVFVGLLSVSKILSGATDAASLKAAKTTISTMLPVVGGIVSGAAEMVLNGASLLKSAVGTFGMLGILAIFLLPFLQLGCSYLMFKLTSALCGIIGSRQTGLLEALSSAMGYTLAMVGSCALMVLLACCCFLRSVQV